MDERTALRIYKNRQCFTPLYLVTHGSVLDTAAFLAETNVFGGRNARVHGPWVSAAALSMLKELKLGAVPVAQGGQAGDRSADGKEPKFDAQVSQCLAYERCCRGEAFS